MGIRSVSKEFSLSNGLEPRILVTRIGESTNKDPRNSQSAVLTGLAVTKNPLLTPQFDPAESATPLPPRR